MDGKQGFHLAVYSIEKPVRARKSGSMCWARGHHMSKRSKPARFIRIEPAILAAAVISVSGGGLHAQVTTGGIYGQVPAAPGETVLIRSSTGISREVSVDAKGHYSADNLPLGSYTVSLRRDGETIDSRDNIHLRVNAGTQVSFAATTTAKTSEAGSLAAVTVTAASIPPIDVSSVDSRTVITSDQINQLPIARSAEAIALLAPGVTQGSQAFAGNQKNNLVSFGGSSVTENAYYINGFNTTDPISGMGGVQLPMGAIDQQEVLTGGYGAAYGRSDGGVINQVGKSGTNEWHFGGQVLYSPNALMGDYKNTHYVSGDRRGQMYRYRKRNGSTDRVESAYLGGPLIKDKLYWFFAAEAEHQFGRNTQSIEQGQTVQQHYQDPKYYTKLNWNITKNHIIEVTGVQSTTNYQGSVYNFDYAGKHNTGFKGYDGSGYTKDKAKLYTVKYTGYITDNLTVSALYGKQWLFGVDNPGSFPGSALPYIAGGTMENPAYTNGGIIRNGQTFSSIENNTRSTSDNFRFDVSYQLGGHTITAGIDNMNTHLENQGQHPTGPGYVWQYGKGAPDEPISDRPGASVDAPGGAGYYVDKYIYETNAGARVAQRAQYIEDRWQVSDRVLLNLGLRNDQFTNYNGQGQAYVRERKPQWAPRLGFAWDVDGDSSFKVYGNAGRYYLAMPASVATRAAAGAVYTRQYYTYGGIDANGVPINIQPIDTARGKGTPISSNNEYGQAPNPKTVAANNLKAEYQDEFILGFDHMLAEHWVYGAKGMLRKLRNAIDDVCDTHTVQTVAAAQGVNIPDQNLRCLIFNPARAGKFSAIDDHGQMRQFTITNEQFGFTQLKRNYYSMELYLEHPLSDKFWVKFDYVYSRSYGDSEGQVKSNIGQSDVSATQDWDYSSLMNYANGDLANDIRHQFKIFGAYQITPEWMVSGNVQIQSGTPRDCLGYFGADETDPAGYVDDAAQSSAYHYCGGKPSRPGDAGRNPWLELFNLSGEYRPSFAKHKLAFSLDVFNVFNQVRKVQSDPDYGRSDARYSNYNIAEYYNKPRYIRFGMSYDF